MLRAGNGRTAGRVSRLGGLFSTAAASSGTGAGRLAVGGTHRADGGFQLPSELKGQRSGTHRYSSCAVSVY